MHVNFVIFNVGSGGNFLARVLTLDPQTVALGNHTLSTAQQRFDVYHYRNIEFQNYNQAAGHGLSQWVHHELHTMYFPFTRGIEKLSELNQLVIEFVHPFSYVEKTKLLGSDDTFDTYHIDVTGCEPWIQKQVQHKLLAPQNITKSQLEQTHELEKICQTTESQAIYLAAILKDDDSFLQEYLRVSAMMKLNAYSDYAVEIYRSWKKTWSPQ